MNEIDVESFFTPFIFLYDTYVQHMYSDIFDAILIALNKLNVLDFKTLY